jgi:hypothetical protein
VEGHIIVLWGQASLTKGLLSQYSNIPYVCVKIAQMDY